MSQLGLKLKLVGQEKVLSVTQEYASNLKWAVLNGMDRGSRFTADDIRAMYPTPKGHPNAIGAVLSGLAKSGYIKRVGYCLSEAPSRHGGLIRLWERI